MSGDGSRISWVGYADLEGKVIASTNNLLLGENVGERPWFRGGLNGGFAGDVHDALLLAKLLGGNPDEPLRFIDLAQPVSSASGTPAGVMGMHINAEWLHEQLEAMSRTLGIELYLLNPDGTIVAASGDTMPDAAPLEILRQAASGIESRGRETWPDGKDYFSSLVASVSHGDLPSFGWRMVGRLDADRSPLRVDLVDNGAHYALAALLGVMGLMTMVFIHIFIRPFGRLGDSAMRVAEGSQEYPEDNRVTREAAQLSIALARLQQDRVSDDP